MINFVIAGILIVIVAFSAGYIISAKKRGVKCIGCPDADKCGKNSCGKCKGCNGE